MAESPKTPVRIDTLIHDLPQWLQAPIREYEQALRKMTTGQFNAFTQHMIQGDDAAMQRLLREHMSLSELTVEKTALTRVTEALASDRQDVRQFGQAIFRAAINAAVTSIVSAV